MKDFLTTYLAVVLAGLTLIFFQEQYVKIQLEQLKITASDAAEQSYKELEQSKLDNEAAEKRIKTETALLLCKDALRAHHKTQETDLEVIRNTTTFAALTYAVAGVGYHAKCIVDDRNRKVRSFDVAKLS